MAVMPNPFPAFNDPKNPKFIKSGKKGNLFVLILDESGSMSSLKNDTVAGVNALLQAQREDPIKSHIIIKSFEGGRIKKIRDQNVETINNLHGEDYRPENGGGTNLLDCVGETILEVNTMLETMYSSKTRPSVIIQITTDGEENSSRKFNNEQIKSLVSKGTEAGWIFTFVGAGIDSFSASHSMGISAAATSNYAKAATEGTFHAMARSVTRMKSLSASGVSNQEMYATNMVYNDSERKDMGNK